MKKLLAMLLALGMLLSVAFCFAGCQEAETQNENTTAATESSATENTTQGGFGGLVDGAIELPAV